LQERIGISANQEVAMLERLNELQIDHERLRAEKRKAETSSSGTADRIRELEIANGTLRNSLTQAEQKLASLSGDQTRTASLEANVQSLRDELEDVQAELEESRARETKQRNQLLQEVSELQAEASKLRTELRQEKRRKAG
jgi:multidrug resistance efflux pump